MLVSGTPCKEPGLIHLSLINSCITASHFAQAFHMAIFWRDGTIYTFDES